MKDKLTLICLFIEFIAVWNITPCQVGCECKNEQCLYCKQGYYRKDIGCEKCYLGCLYCTAEYDCDLCDSLFFLHNGSCYSCAQGCQACEMIESRHVCKSCLAGYYRFDDICKPCLPNCVLCFSPEFCQKCEDMFYVNVETLTCTQCPKNCELCTSSTRCQKCQPGYHGTYCQKSCSSGCIDDVCDQKTEICNKGCRENFTGDSCDTCKPGIYGLLCEHQCPQNCDECYSDTLCQNCHSGYYGKTCEQACPDGCHIGSCIQETGECYLKLCKKGLGGPYCNECLVEGDTLCGKDCFEHCLSCASDFECLYCMPGYFGKNCSQKCSSGCLYNQCGQQTGICHGGKCKINFRNDYCDHCVTGKYGAGCEQNCPKYCNDNTCNSANGNCLSGCQVGMYGIRCENKCPTSCKTCVSEILCSECNEGYWGTRCQRCPMTCLKEQCYPDGSCISCLPGLYGVFCNMSCSNTCLINACGRNGECFGCKPDYFGTSCSQKCPRHCHLSNCTGIDVCTNCTDRYTGKECDIELISNLSNNYPTNKNTCYTNCLNATCIFGSDTCALGCKNGFYGLKCDHKCDESCIFTCHRHSGECIADCIQGENDTLCLKSNSVIETGNGHTIMTICLISGGVLVGIVTCLACVIRRHKKRRLKPITNRKEDNDDGYEIPIEMASLRQGCPISGDSNQDQLQVYRVSQTLVKRQVSLFEHFAADENNIYDLPIEQTSDDLVEENLGETQQPYYITCI